MPISMPELEVVYLPFPGRAEPVRLALTLGGVPFKDTRLAKEELVEYVKKTPMGQFPVLYVDGRAFGQSMAQLRYVGSITSYNGSKLYPKEDPLKCLKVDEMLDTISGLCQPLVPTFSMPPEARDATRKKLLSKGGCVYSTLEQVDGQLRQGTEWIAGNEVTIADLYLFCIVGLFRSGYIEGVSFHLLDDFPAVVEHRCKVALIPAISSYYERSSDPLAFAFRP